MKNSLGIGKIRLGILVSPFSSCTIDPSIDRSGDRPATYLSEPLGHEDERGECRKVLSAAPGNQLGGGGEGARKSEGLFGCLQCQEEKRRAGA